MKSRKNESCSPGQRMMSRDAHGNDPWQARLDNLDGGQVPGGNFVIHCKDWKYCQSAT